MKRDKDILKELQDIAPELSKLKKDLPYKVPVDYFAEFPQDVQKTISEQQKAPVSVWRWLQQYLFQPKYAVAYASVVLVCVVGYFVLRNPAVEPAPEVSFGELAYEDVKAYVHENMTEFDEALLVEDALAMGLDDMNEGNLNISDEEIKDYLIDDIDNQILEEDLL